ncbi:hypothetical protein M427DRAFT_132202 [Gonapodya prolifera JEL478]|uniref:Uncharacterized protein n=1 Tax=Gonapodya prolifera (strain JEL478) TaxID=1344416 RepID=A0A139AR03_GONPJ|nr:hypothetical protein M427DRAFT_132202 [Gonapodya prolifera JEL478]|eukprot:KXS19180.1 hypothetical protein M427DRAFT_132202 [Gonapodya prolifera JEL478]
MTDAPVKKRGRPPKNQDIAIHHPASTPILNGLPTSDSASPSEDRALPKVQSDMKRGPGRPKKNPHPANANASPSGTHTAEHNLPKGASSIRQLALQPSKLGPALLAASKVKSSVSTIAASGATTTLTTKERKAVIGEQSGTFNGLGRTVAEAILGPGGSTGGATHQKTSSAKRPPGRPRKNTTPDGATATPSPSDSLNEDGEEAAELSNFLVKRRGRPPKSSPKIKPSSGGDSVTPSEKRKPGRPKKPTPDGPSNAISTPSAKRKPGRQPKNPFEQGGALSASGKSLQGPKAQKTAIIKNQSIPQHYETSSADSGSARSLKRARTGDAEEDPHQRRKKGRLSVQKPDPEDEEGDEMRVDSTYSSAGTAKLLQRLEALEDRVAELTSWRRSLGKTQPKEMGSISRAGPAKTSPKNQNELHSERDLEAAKAADEELQRLREDNERLQKDITTLLSEKNSFILRALKSESLVVKLEKQVEMLEARVPKKTSTTAT